MPTTSRFRDCGCVTRLGVRLGMSAPEVALNFTWVPMAPAGNLKPRAEASLSVSTTSEAESDDGMRPAIKVGVVLEAPVGGSETSWPAGAAPGVLPARGEAPVELKEPVIPTWPQADRTCGRLDRTESVAPSKAGTLAPATG